MLIHLLISVGLICFTKLLGNLLGHVPIWYFQLCPLASNIVCVLVIGLMKVMHDCFGDVFTPTGYGGFIR